MKKANKVFSVVLAVVLVMAMAIPAFAATWTGSITINSADNVSVNGKTFKAYKILAAAAVNAENLDAGVVYSIPEEMQSFYNTLLGSTATVDAVVAYLEAGTTDLQDFAVKALAAAKAASVTPAEATGAEDKATFSDLPFGYYVIEDETTSGVVSALMLRSSSAEVTLKADMPTIEKKIDGSKDTDDTTSGLVDYNTARIGDEVPYVITSKVPDMTGYKSYTYTVTDTFSAGLTYNDDIAVTVGEKTLAKDTDYTVAENGQTLTISFNDFISYTKGDAISITYSATVNNSAIVGVEGNENTVKLTYSSNPQDASKTTNTPDDVVRTYVVGLILNKVDGDNKPLAGAEFAIKNGVATVATGTSDADGKVVFTWTDGLKGLLDGETYIIVETTAPIGYNAAENIEFTVTCTDPTGTNTDCVWNSSNTAVTFEKTEGTAEDYFTATIENLTGAILPETGGIGTTILYVVGAILVIGAVILLITKKRMSAEA